jgi:hypothetical protein
VVHDAEIPQFADAVQLKDGEWLVVFPSVTGSPEGGSVMLTRAGQIQGPWSGPEPVVQMTTLCRNATITQMNSGLIQMVFETGIDSDEYWNRRGTVLVQSYDYGQKFTVPRIIQTPDSLNWGHAGPIVEYGENQSLLPVLFTSDSMTCPGILRSDDLGESWSKIYPVTRESNVTQWHMSRWNHELLAVLELKNESMLFTASSSDTGKTWTALQRINIYGKSPVAVQTADGTVLCFYEDQTPPGISLMSSYDRGLTFENELSGIFPGLLQQPAVTQTDQGPLVLLGLTEQGIVARLQNLDKPAVPGSLSVTEDSSGVVLRWKPVKSAAYYHIYRSESLQDSVFGDKVRIASVNGNQFLDHSMDKDRSYAYEITAVAGFGPVLQNQRGESSPSDPVLYMNTTEKTGEQ